MHEINDFKLVEVKGEEYDTPSCPPSSPALETLQMTGNHSFFESMHEINDFELVEAKGEEYDTPSCPPSSPALEMLQMTGNHLFLNLCMKLTILN